MEKEQEKSGLCEHPGCKSKADGKEPGSCAKCKSKLSAYCRAHLFKCSQVECKTAFCYRCRRVGLVFCPHNFCDTCDQEWVTCNKHGEDEMGCPACTTSIRDNNAGLVCDGIENAIKEIEDGKEPHEMVADLKDVLYEIEGHMNEITQPEEFSHAMHRRKEEIDAAIQELDRRIGKLADAQQFLLDAKEDIDMYF